MRIRKKYKMPHGWYKLRKNGNKWMHEQNCLIFDTNNYRRHQTNNKDFIEELAERKISLKDFFDLLNVWEGMRYAEKGIVIRKLVEEEKK